MLYQLFACDDNITVLNKLKIWFYFSLIHFIQHCTLPSVPGGGLSVPIKVPSIDGEGSEVEEWVAELEADRL